MEDDAKFQALGMAVQHGHQHGLNADQIVQAAKIFLEFLEGDSQ